MTPLVLIFILNLMMHNRNPYRLVVPLLLTLFIILSSCNAEDSIERQIKKLNLKYRIDSEGDYRVQVIIPENRNVEVGVSAHTESLEKNVRVREIWSVAVRIPGKLPEGLAENLLRDSWSTRKFGSWALAGTTSDGKQVLVYISRIPESSSVKVLHAAMMDTAESARGLHDALSELEGE